MSWVRNHCKSSCLHYMRVNGLLWSLMDKLTQATRKSALSCVLCGARECRGHSWLEIRAPGLVQWLWDRSVQGPLVCGWAVWWLSGFRRTVSLLLWSQLLPLWRQNFTDKIPEIIFGFWVCLSLSPSSSPSLSPSLLPSYFLTTSHMDLLIRQPVWTRHSDIVANRHR